MLTANPWAFSAHAKDIWTLPEWEKREKLADCDFGVTCTEANHLHLQGLGNKPDRIHRVYHGLDFERFREPPDRPADNSGINKDRPVCLLSVGRAVPKKGYATLLNSLARLPTEQNWKFIHIGGGTELDSLQSLARQLDIDNKIEWKGAQPQEEVLASYRQADLFVLASVINEDGDRDGLPNVLMEAQSQKLCCVSTNISGTVFFI